MIAYETYLINIFIFIFKGLDTSFHGGSAYPESHKFNQDMEQSMKGGNTTELTSIKTKVAELEGLINKGPTNGATNGVANGDVQ